MTKNEAAIIMAYTGTTLLTGEDFSIFHKYIEEKLKRPVLTHELADKVVEEQIKEATKEDFINLCKNLENETTAQWDFVHYDPDYLVYSGTCTACGKMHNSDENVAKLAYCPNCGAIMYIKDGEGEIAADPLLGTVVDREQFNRAANEIGDSIEDGNDKMAIAVFVNELEEKLFGGK